jgi:uncharacterized protein
MPPASSESATMNLNDSSPFQFRCYPELPCFTQCCRDVNIYLTAYDVLRMRSKLGISSAQFLAKYTRHFLSKKTNLPIVQLAMDPQTLYCRLVTDLGCSVYADRPWACRMYPLDLTNISGEYRTIVNEQKCLGLREPSSSTILEWLQDQGIEPYLQMDGIFRSMVPVELIMAGKIDAGLGKLVFLAYDLDRFAELLTDKRFRDFHSVDEAMVQGAEDDPEALLALAFKYIRSQMEELL